MRRLTALAFMFALSAALPAQAQDKTITVFAAASMKNAIDDIDAAFTKATDIKAVASLAASSALAKQIEQGAPADVFASADLEWMDYLDQKKLIKNDTRVNLLGNKLVLIAPKDSKLDNVKIEQGFDIANENNSRLGGWVKASRRAIGQGGNRFSVRSHSGMSCAGLF